MGLKNLEGIRIGLRHMSILFVLFAFLLIGCGESEEATTEEAAGGETKVKEEKPEALQPPETVKEEKPKAEEKPMDEALTSFVGSESEKPSEAPAPPVVAPTQLAQYEKQIEDLRTENTGLKQKIVKLEQENRGINARFSEIEAKYAAEKERADKAEELAKSTQAPKAVSTEEPKVTPAEKAVAPTSMSAYEEALKAFNSKKYDDAAKSFKAIVDGGASDDSTNRAKYWLGESNFARKKYKEALTLFQEVLKFKSSEKKADAQFMIAQTHERLGNKIKAKEAYERVVKDYPMSKNVKRAKERWAKL